MLYNVETGRCFTIPLDEYLPTVGGHWKLRVSGRWVQVERKDGTKTIHLLQHVAAHNLKAFGGCVADGCAERSMEMDPSQSLKHTP